MRLIDNKLMLLLLVLTTFMGCKQEKQQPEVKRSIEVIQDSSLQKEIFQSLMQIASNKLISNMQQDSLSFFVLPLKASCPHCRKKSIDSIIKYQAKLDSHHYIVLSGEGMGEIVPYFSEGGHRVPLNNKNIIIDSSNEAFLNNLIFSKPIIYCSNKGKVNVKISCVPATINRELAAFFSFN